MAMAIHELIMAVMQSSMLFTKLPISCSSSHEQ
jgi:hypothetical protein